MSDDSKYSSVTDRSATNKRKYEDQTPPPPPSTRRPTGFSSPDAAHAPPFYNSVPPPVDEIQIAKQKAQEIAARLLSGAGAAAVGAADVKRSRVENGAGDFDSSDKDAKSLFSNSAPSAIPVSYGSYMGSTSKKIDIPNGRVGVIIGKAGETIKYLQLQSGAKIQVTRDMDADPNSPYRPVELMGTPEQIAKAEQLINEVLAEADAGGSGTVSRRFTGQDDSEQFVMRIPNNKVGLVIGKGGDNIKNMQARTGARIQVVPLHLPPGNTSLERSVHIDGTTEQIDAAKQLVNEVISENRPRNTSMTGGYPQQGYQTRPPTSWGPPPMQQPGYGYMQPGAYPGQSAQYNMSQPPYGDYPPHSASGGYPSNWNQSTGSQQMSQGYEYYSQPHSSQQQPSPGGPAAPADNTGYNYGQPPASGYNQHGQGYTQNICGGYPQSGYGQPLPYDQQQGYTSASTYGNMANPSQEGHASSYGAQGESAQAPAQPSSVAQQGYSAGQPPSSNPVGYPPQATTQPGYGMPPTSQTGYGNQQPLQPGYGSSYGPPQAQKPPANPPVYGQVQQSPSTPGSYSQAAPVQAGYPHSQPPPSSYSQPDLGPHHAPPSTYGATASQPGYGPPYGAPPAHQPSYGHAPPPYNTSYGSGYSQPAPATYATDGNPTNNTCGTYDAPPTSQSSQQSGVSKKSPQG